MCGKLRNLFYTMLLLLVALYMFLTHFKSITYQLYQRISKRSWQIDTYHGFVQDVKKNVSLCLSTHLPAQHTNKKVPLLFYIISSYLFVGTHNLIWITKPRINSSHRRNMQWMLIFFFALDHFYDVWDNVLLMSPFSPSIRWVG